jgi:3-oxoacyl-[acyl-carrier protein] reductase
VGPILTIQEALKTFGPDGGSIINISSIVSTNPVPNSLVYAATKSAVDSITRVLSKELGARRIRVNRIGIIGSDFQKQMVAATPLGRFGQPEDIARVAVFLASEDSEWVTGERITASGGLH